MPEIQIPEKLLPLATEHKRFKVAIGGRGSGKTDTIASLLSAEVVMKGIRVLGAREMMNSIEDSVHASVSAQIDKYDMPGFDIQAAKINHANGGGFIYRGLARNPEGLKSIHDVGRAWVEEAHTVSENSIELLTPSVRADGSELWFSANPRSSNDPFSKRFIKPFERNLRKYGYYADDLHLIIFVNFYDNPWFPPELEQERQFDKANKSAAKYAHIWLGEYDDTVEDAIIQPDWFDACVDAHKILGFDPLGIEVVSHDPSDTGNDAKGLCYRHGVVIKDVQSKETGDVNEGADWAIDYVANVKPDLFVWDGDGMGVGLRRQFSDAFDDKKIDYQMFRGSGAVDRPDEIYEVGKDDRPKTNKESFRNKRAQYYWQLRDRCWKTWQAVEKGKYYPSDDLISFSGDIEELALLRAEICRIPQKHNPSGLIQIATKEEMRRLKIQSPNLADAVMMSWDIPEIDDDWGEMPQDEYRMIV